MTRQRRRPPKEVAAPLPSKAATATSITAIQSSESRRQDGYAAPTAEDRADAELLAEAERRGYRLAVRCVDCGHYVVSAASIAAHRGPKCRARAGVSI